MSDASGGPTQNDTITIHTSTMLPSTIKLWNTLPEDVVNQPSINCFKDILLNYFDFVLYLCVISLMESYTVINK